MAEYKKMKNENPDLNLMPPAPSPLHSTETADDVKNVITQSEPQIVVKLENKSSPISIKPRVSHDSLSVDTMVDIVEALEAASSNVPSQSSNAERELSPSLDVQGPPLSIEATLFDADIKIDIDTDNLIRSIDDHIEINEHIEIDDINPLPLDLDLFTSNVGTSQIATSQQLHVPTAFNLAAASLDSTPTDHISVGTTPVEPATVDPTTVEHIVKLEHREECINVSKPLQITEIKENTNAELVQIAESNEKLFDIVIEPIPEINVLPSSNDEILIEAEIESSDLNETMESQTNTAETNSEFMVTDIECHEIPVEANSIPDPSYYKTPLNKPHSDKTMESSSEILTLATSDSFSTLTCQTPSPLQEISIQDINSTPRDNSPATVNLPSREERANRSDVDNISLEYVANDLVNSTVTSLVHNVVVEQQQQQQQLQWQRTKLDLQCNSLLADFIQDAIQTLAEETVTLICDKIKQENELDKSDLVVEDDERSKEIKNTCNIKEEFIIKEDQNSYEEANDDISTNAIIKEELSAHNESKDGNNSLTQNIKENKEYCDISEKLKENGPSIIIQELTSFCKTLESGVDSSAESLGTEEVHSKPKVDKQWKKEVMLLYQMIYNHKYSSIFLHLVTNAEAPGYTDMVYNPTCLLSIKKAIEKGVIRNIDEFERDVYLMFSNANMYNSDIALECDMAKEMFDEAKANIQSFRESQSFGKELSMNKPEEKIKIKYSRGRKRTSETQEDSNIEDDLLRSRVKELKKDVKPREITRDCKAHTPKSSKKENKRKSKK